MKEFFDYKIRGGLYRLVMKVAHKYNWHYAPPVYPDGDIQLWCKWCGFRETFKRKDFEFKDILKRLEVILNE